MKKVFLNRKPVEGPWGGGNKTVKMLEKFIKNDKDLLLTYNLKDKDIDVILCVDPKPDNNGIWYQDFINYKNNINKNTKILQRVGDVGSHRSLDLKKLITKSANFSDFVIFPSNWSKDYIKFNKKNYSIIENQPISTFYKSNKNKKSNKINLITHHWSNNPKKGFEIYSFLGKCISNNVKGFENITFTYIGRFNESYSKEGINIISPKHQDELANLLPNFDVYITASEEEAGANHVLEGLAAGLPVLFKDNGGSINEYCFKYGLSFKGKSDLLEAIKAISDSLSFYSYLTKNRPKENLENQIKKYIKIIKEI